MKLRVLHHDHCFDGLASAAVFSRFYSEEISPSSEIGFNGLSHKPNQVMIEEELFDGEENAIVDFKYSPSPRLTWWFDHHQSAFLSRADEEHYYREKSPTKFYDASYKSCTKFIADILSEKYGFDQGPMSDLIKWADIIDGALYEDAKTAVELKAPAMQLMLVIEASRNPGLMGAIIRDMQTRRLADIITSNQIQSEFRPLHEQHLRMIDLIREKATFEKSVAFFDLSEYNAEGYSKFIPYYLFPECVYSVGVSLSEFRSKVSVGFNPWSPRPRRHNLASICERYNGGGHAVVGAISYKREELQLARQTAREIVRELQS